MAAEHGKKIAATLDVVVFYYFNHWVNLRTLYKEHLFKSDGS